MAPTAEDEAIADAAVALLRARFVGAERDATQLDRRLNDPRIWMRETAGKVGAVAWVERFLEKTAFDPLTGCLVWTAALNHDGYGHFRVGKSTKRVSRLVCETWVGNLPRRKNALHDCHNRACANPWHLQPGTQRDNVHDAIESGRFLGGRVSELTDTEKQAILDLYERRHTHPGITQKSIADELGIERMTVAKLVRAAREGRFCWTPKTTG